MRIAFDAKRIFKNSTGLGHYSRTLVSALAKGFPEHEYYLAAPELTSLYDYSGYRNMQTVTPSGLARHFKNLWRSKGVIKDLEKQKIDLYHGLSHEIPVGIPDSDIKTVVTIHDLIFERYPHQYSAVDGKIYRTKCKYACANADRIIAISKQTKDDIMYYYAVPGNKITVCYQSCNEMYRRTVSPEEKHAIKNKYRLPDKFFLFVGSVIERKNLMSVCKAMHLLNAENRLNIPLVVIGAGGNKYMQKVKSYIDDNQLHDAVIFISEDLALASDEGFASSADFPAIYQQAVAMVYPSSFEGFGIPVLEALNSRLPVITSNVSCLPETGGDAAYYVGPYDIKEMAEAMYRTATDEALRASMIEKGLQHAQKFTPERCAADVMEVYRSLGRK